MLNSGVLTLTLKLPSPKRLPTDSLFMELDEMASTVRGAGAATRTTGAGAGIGTTGAGARTRTT